MLVNVETMEANHLTLYYLLTYNETNPWPESANELYRPSDHRLSAKLLPTFGDRRVPSSQLGVSPTTVISAF
jgi:hypothetical protein